MKMTKAISPQKKKECIDYALAHPEIDTPKLAADFGIGHSTLSGWLKKARQRGVQGASRSRNFSIWSLLTNHTTDMPPTCNCLKH
jgi:transposase-like protein